MKAIETEKKQIHYFQVTDIWQKFCEAHSTLLDLTCDEYSYLLSSELEKLDEVIETKQNVIREINLLEKLRSELINAVNQTIDPLCQIANAADLLNYFESYEIENEQNFLKKFNHLLVELIEKIQAQNKKNQLFINKAILSLKEIRESATGKKSFPIYNSAGNSL